MTVRMKRNMSPQAWRRLRNSLTEGELKDLAADLAMYSNGNPSMLVIALTVVDWEKFQQA